MGFESVERTRCEVSLDDSGVWVDYPSWIIPVSQYQGSKIKLTRNGSIQYTFVKEIGEVGDSVTFATGYSSWIITTDLVEADIPSDAVYCVLLYVYVPTASIYQLKKIESFEIFTKDGELVNDYTTQIQNLIAIKTFGDIDVIVYTSNFPFVTAFFDGQYYAVMSDGTEIWYSEIFTVVNDIKPYLKIEWWDVEDFVMDAGAIVYTEPQFKNVLYLDSDLAKPEYPFEEEGEIRDGYFFPIKQISEKHYRFKFFASEYLLDVMRFIRMADYARITYKGQTYNLDTFLITPDWEDNGDVASVEAEFDTATVAKKIGRGYIVPNGGDFNNDFSADFDNEPNT